MSNTANLKSELDKAIDEFNFSMNLKNTDYSKLG